MDDPRAYLVEPLRGAALRGRCAECTERDEELLGLVVDESAASLPDGLPTDSKKLGGLNSGFEGRRRSLPLSEEHRHRVPRAAEARFAEPPMAVVGDRVKVALQDHHLLPGAWGSSGRDSEEVLEDAPAIARLGFFDDQVRARQGSGPGPHSLTVQVGRRGSLLRRAGTSNWFAADPVGRDALLSGEARMQGLSWRQGTEGNAGPRFIDAHPRPMPAAE